MNPVLAFGILFSPICTILSSYVKFNYRCKYTKAASLSTDCFSSIFFYKLYYHQHIFVSEESMFLAKHLLHLLVVQGLQQLNCTFLLLEHLRKYCLGYLLKNAVFSVIHHFLCHVGIPDS
jgi:hypothetical protein